MPVDNLFNLLNEATPSTLDEWLQRHEKNLELAYRNATQRLQCKARERKTRHDVKVKGQDELAVGQIVLIRSHPKGRNKIQDVWSNVPYKIVAKVDPATNAYLIKRVDGFGQPKTINRVNMRVCDKFGQSSLESDSDPDDFVLDMSGNQDADRSLPPNVLPQVTRVPSSSLHPSQNTGSTRNVTPPVAPTPSSSSQSPQAVRCSSRANKGTHSNVHHLPKSVISSQCTVSYDEFSVAVNQMGKTVLENLGKLLQEGPIPK